VILRACPGPSCFGPGLNIFNSLLRFSDLVPSNGTAGSVIATSQSESGEAKSENHKAFSVQRSTFSGRRSVVALQK
jgi:hypothetical protein